MKAFVKTMRSYLFGLINLSVVAQLSDYEAEFTPTNIQAKEDRRLVYAVTINLKNDDLALKPGMIADVTFKN